MSEKRASASLEALQNWYHFNCDGDWEHEFGIKIETIDNPGWAVSIPLEGTSLEARPFVPIRWQRSRGEWIMCRLEGLTFLGDGGTRNLSDIIQVFLDWAEDARRTTPE